MVRTPDDSDRDFSPGLSEDNINADIAELFSSLPPGVEEFFAEGAEANRNAHSTSNKQTGEVATLMQVSLIWISR
jgi:hypothetical protein